MVTKRFRRPATPSEDGLPRLGVDDRPSDPSDELFRKALYKPVSVASGGTMRTLDAFYESLSASVAKGDVAAIKHLDLIVNHRRATDAVREAAAAREASPVAALVRKQQQLAKIAVPFAIKIYLRLLPEMVALFERSHDPFELRSAFVPYYIDLEAARAVLSRAERRLKRQRRGQPYDVGRGKPPTKSRFTTENNPARRRRETSSWETLDRSLNKPVTVRLANGSQASSTRAKVSHEQLTRRAIAGDRAARTIVLARIFALERQGKLSPPLRPGRKRRVVIDEQMKAKLVTVEALATARIRDELIALFARNLGSAPPVLDAEAEPPGLGENGPATSPSLPPDAF